MCSAGSVSARLCSKPFNPNNNYFIPLMMNQDPFRNSELDRAKPKRHIFYSFINQHFKRHRSDTGLVEDRTSSVTIVRIIVGLLMIHLFIIGGVLLRGQMVKESGSSVAGPVSITPPPTPLAPPPTEAAPAMQDALPQPTAPAVPTARPIATANHITQAVQEDEAADEAEAEPTIVSPPSVPAAPAEPLKHRVAPGDTIYRICNQYGVSEAALKSANPSLGQGVLRAGATLTIPTGAQPAAQPAPQQAARPAAAPAVQPAAHQPAVAHSEPAASPKVYTVQRGETLSRISRKTKVSVKELIQINGIKNPNSIRPGMELRLSR